MAYFSIILLFFIGIVEWIIEKKIYNLLTGYCFFWVLIMMLAELRLFGMYDYSDKAYSLILIGSIGYAIGYWLFRFSGIRYTFPKKKIHETDLNYDYEEINYKLIYFLVIVALIFYSFMTIKVLLMFNEGYSYYIIRRMYQGYENNPFFNSTFISYLNSYVGMSIIYLLCPILIIEIFKKRKNYKLLTLISITLSLYLFCTASRYIIFNLVFQIVFMMFFYQKKIPKRYRKKLRNIVVILLMLVIGVTIFRENKPTYNSSYDWGMDKSVYSYFSISVPLLDYWANYIDSSNYISYGLVTFRAPLSIFTLLFLRPFGFKFEALNNAIEIINNTDQFIQVFPGHTYNAFATIFYYFYVDFREIGVFMGCLFLGAICGHVFKKAVNTQRYRYLVFMLLLVQALFKTMVRWEFYTSGYFIAFIIVFFICKRRVRGNFLI